MKKALFLPVLLFSFFGVSGQKKMTVPEYVQKYQGVAIEEMKKYKIPASITMAQGILESANGNSELARNAHNHFGIKCKPEWTGGRYYYDDDTDNECFRKYATDLDSYHDHSIFLTTRQYYRSLFSLNIHDYKSWAYGLKKSGYATEPLYAEMLIKIIEDNRLYRLDSAIMISAADTLLLTQITPDKNSTHVRSDTVKKISKITGINNQGSDFPDIVISDSKMNVLENNNVKYVIARKDDTYGSIADYFGLAVFDLLRYNDVNGLKPLSPGTRVYIGPKRKSCSTDFHTVAAGETMQDISQFYAIQLKELYKKNRMKQGFQPGPGQKIWLKNAMPIY